MTRLERALHRISADLDGAGRSWCLVGGLAVSARAEPRTTRDVDVVVSVDDDADAEGLIFALQNAGYRIATVLQQASTRRLATVRLIPPGEHDRGVLVDLLFASSSVESEIASAANKIRILPNLTIPVATVGHLLALKVLARDGRKRPQDDDDIRALLKEATSVDLDQARNTLRLIEGRGAHRGKALCTDFEQLIEGS